MKSSLDRSRPGSQLAYFVLILIGNAVTVMGAAAVPASQAVNPLEKDLLDRSRQFRKILLDTLEQAYQNHGNWPERITPQEPKLIYVKPPIVSDSRLAEELTTATVVLREPLESRPKGIWVGYADGHMEFVPDASALVACERQTRIIQDAIARCGSLFDVPAGHPPGRHPADTLQRGSLVLQILDPAGKPISGALIGLFGHFAEAASEMPRVYFPAPDGQKDQPRISDAGGFATIHSEEVFAPDRSRFSDAGTAPLYVFDEQRRLVALEELHRSEFGTAMHTRVVRLQPACKACGEVRSIGLADLGRAVSGTSVFAFRTAHFQLRAVSSTFSSARFELFLPPGDFCVSFRASDCYSARRYIRIEPNERELNLRVNLEPEITLRLLGRPAPELQHVKGWLRDGPVNLAELRGKVILLEFWASWCGPCIARMPDVMQLYDRYHDKGLVVITIHDNSLGSVQELEAKVHAESAKSWNGRNPPFTVALDGAADTRIRGTTIMVPGATLAEYGVTTLPMSVLIGRDGKVVGPIDVRRSDASSKIQDALDAK